MNYYEPREIMNKETGKGTGKWRYTQMRDHEIWAVGYCRDGNCAHDTKEQAYEHMRQYILDKTEYNLTRRALNPDKTLSQLPCEVCQKPSDGHIIETAFPQRTILHICSAHVNRESLEKVLTVGDQWSSW